MSHLPHTHTHTLLFPFFFLNAKTSAKGHPRVLEFRDRIGGAELSFPSLFSLAMLKWRLNRRFVRSKQTTALLKC